MASPSVEPCRRPGRGPAAGRAGGERCPPGGRWSGPAGQAELLRLLLDVVVVELRALLGARLTGAHLDGDLLQVRALDRGEELQGRSGLAGLEVRLGVLGDLGDVGRQLARLAQERALRRSTLDVGVAAGLRGGESDELL